VPPATLHKLIPFGVAGFVLNLLTGIWFFSAFPNNISTTRHFNCC
jgi:hypothetical protein